MKFIDIETNGLNPYYHEPIEVAWVDLDHTVTETAFSLPFDTIGSEEKAFEVNGWGNRAFAPRLKHSDAVPLITVGLRDEILVGNNIAFDMAFLSAYLRRHRREPTRHHSGFDLKSLVAGHMGVSPTLVTTEGIIRHFALAPQRFVRDRNEPQGPVKYHGALYDAKWNRQIYELLNLWGG